MTSPIARKTLGNAGALVMGSGIEAVLQFAFVLIASRQLGPADYGFYEYVISIVTFLLAIVNFGLPVVAVREIAREPQTLGIVYSAMFRIRAWLSALFFLGGVVVVMMSAQ